MQLPNIRNCREIAAGGEGRILEHPNGKDVIKVYHQPRPLKFQKHLEDLSRLSSAFVKPVEVYTDTKHVLGFSMAYVNLNDYWLFNNLFNKGFCTSNNLDDSFKTTVLSKLKRELEQIHSKKIYVGDLNQYNLFVNSKAELLFVDVDSFKTFSQDHSGVLLDDIRDWTTSVIDEKSDSWSYDILVFWAMSYCHPFKWVVPGNKESLEQRVKDSKSILSKITGIKIPPLYKPFSGSIVQQFTEVFKGRRYMVNLDNTSFAQAPTKVIQPIPTSDLIMREIMKDVSEVFTNTTQITARTPKGWSLFATDTLKVVREIYIGIHSEVEYLFPSTQIGEHVSLKDRRLYSTKGITADASFMKPEFYFTDGSLVVVDYAKDMQYNYDVSRQLAGSIHKNSTTVFAKSILFRNAPIQNFGRKKYLNIPNKDKYFMLPVSEHTKDAHYCGGYAAIETKNKSTEYELILNNKTIKQLEYLPFFTTKGGNVLIPDDGFIEVVDSTGSTVVKFNVSNCSRTSRLYSTDSGILLLEDKILYLLNTK
jgi:hypothetical protein